MSQEPLFPEKKRFHFIGIGGIGMSALAKTLHHLGFSVSGSDVRESDQLENMRRVGIQISKWAL